MENRQEKENAFFALEVDPVGMFKDERISGGGLRIIRIQFESGVA
jgi:hypothetical protein